MRRIGSSFVVLATAAVALAAGSGAASAAGTGDITVFRTELTPVTTYQDPHGCQKLPADAHVLVNRTNRPVRVHGDPLCLTPGPTVRPGHGFHVPPGSGSFSA